MSHCCQLESKAHSAFSSGYSLLDSAIFIRTIHSIQGLSICCGVRSGVKGVARGKGEIPSPPPKPKKQLQKNGVISEGSIFSYKFSKKNNKNKNNKKYNFSIEFSSKNFKIFQQFVFFVQTRKKLTHSLLTYLKNMLK